MRRSIPRKEQELFEGSTDQLNPFRDHLTPTFSVEDANTPTCPSG